MIVVTGAAGFIGSCMAGKLNREGITDLILVDDFSKENKRRNWENKEYSDKINRRDFFAWAEQNVQHVDAIIHLGARTDTTETDESVFEELNIDYTEHLWSYAAQYGKTLLYASSAATYGAGELGYVDDENLIPQLKPLNAYGRSKNVVDQWILKQTKCPPHWAGFKFFNVFGPNEYHKGRMASVIFHASHQIQSTGKVKLFRSHRPDCADGQQRRDFIYVKDVVNTLHWFCQQHHPNGIFNLGTGHARSFYDLAVATFRAMGVQPSIEYIDIPEDIRNKYQYFTEADMLKLHSSGCTMSFHSLEDGVTDYVSNYLIKEKIF
ncbi:MAG: ADP-glyceromanno-heptose 6-epimerase [Bacteroidales bacterium]|nr:ADP-glyceromanno-heptose 6-epimerase [Bacteroidales bacterium]